MPSHEKEKDQYSGLLSPWLRNLRINAVLPWLTGTRILDYGCGIAELYLHVAQDYDYTGVEPIPEVFEVATKRFPDANIVRGSFDIHTDGLLALLDPPYDSIVLLAVIEHVPSPAELVADLYEVLAPDGRLIMTTPAPNGQHVLSITEALGLSSPESHEEHQDLLGKADLQQILHGAGFRVEAYRRFLLGLNQIVIGQKQA